MINEFEEWRIVCIGISAKVAVVVGGVMEGGKSVWVKVGDATEEVDNIRILIWAEKSIHMPEGQREDGWGLWYRRRVRKKQVRGVQKMFWNRCGAKFFIAPHINFLAPHLIFNFLVLH